MPDIGVLTRPVVLVGMMGSGKTAIGTALAERLGVPFRDTDEAIVDASRMSIAEIFERDGEPFFRAREAEVLQRLLALGPGIVSTGGGAFLRAENREAIRSAGVSVWLRAAEPLLWSRVKHRTTRPLLRTDNPRATLQALLAEREPSYAQASLAVDADPSYSIADMVDQVVATLRAADILKD
ncbi:shikimate kinase [Jannaschia sp. M317]|uniref:shikimate kinase n=1 Tax=Jannaschia sp. M317 TaxID=2867011 RepID=UPI0021A87FB7|nr:shikimate kinase [Jannaschia sp. M317]